MKKKIDHPRGLSPSDREKWHNLCEELFRLYSKMPIGETKRMVIAGCDEKNQENILFFFKGNLDDILKIREMLD